MANPHGKTYGICKNKCLVEVSTKEDVDTHINDTTNPHSVTKAQVGLGNVDNTSDANKPISSATQTALNAKQATITGAASIIASANLTPSRVLVSNANGKVGASSVTSTELGYVSGVTSNIQTQLDGKQDNLIFDNKPTTGSNNPVKSGGVKTALNAKADKTEVSSGLALKQDKLTFDNTPTEGSTNPVTSGGVYDALSANQGGVSLYEHTIRVKGTQSGGEIIKFTLTVLNQSPTAFTFQTLWDYFGSADDNYKECSGITKTIGAQMEIRHAMSVRGGAMGLNLETVNPATGSIDRIGLPLAGGHQITLADKVRQIL